MSEISDVKVCTLFWLFRSLFVFASLSLFLSFWVGSVAFGRALVFATMHRRSPLKIEYSFLTLDLSFLNGHCPVISHHE